MSANNCTIIAEKDKKYYVFSNINAESWDETPEMELSMDKADGVSDDFEEAYKKAEIFETDEWNTEYGICVGHLPKDGTPIKLI